MKEKKRKDAFETIVTLYENVPEPRVKGRCKHKLVDILVLVTCGYLCGVEDWEELELFANEKIDWFKKYLELPSGIPSHDTLLRTFKLIDPKAFELIFFEWIQKVTELKKGQVIAFDGKRITGTYPFSGSDRGQALSLLNIWAVDDNVSLGQLKISVTGFPESVGIKECLDYINIKGMIITADAASSFPTLANKIIDKGGDYLLPVKISNLNKSQDLQILSLSSSKKKSYKKTERHKGRGEMRMYEVVRDLKIIEEYAERYHWPSLKSIGIVTYYRQEKDRRIVKPILQGEDNWKWIKVDDEYREFYKQKFYLSSLDLTAEGLATKSRSHWHVENKLNWHLDVTFNEDGNKTRDKVAAENMSLVRKICINLLKHESTLKKSLKLKKRKCQMNESYLEKVLFNFS
jgi:predicted transposase YbfD/YdcC